MGVKVFLHELYPSPLTANKEFIANQNKSQKKRKKSACLPKSLPFSSIMNERYRRSCGALLEPPSTVNKLTTQTVLPFTSSKELNSMKDTPLATSQRDDSKFEPDSKSKDGSIDPPQSQGDETDPRENQDDNSQAECGSD